MDVAHVIECERLRLSFSVRHVAKCMYVCVCVYVYYIPVNKFYIHIYICYTGACRRFPLAALNVITSLQVICYRMSIWHLSHHVRCHHIHKGIYLFLDLYSEVKRNSNVIAGYLLRYANMTPIPPFTMSSHII